MGRSEETKYKMSKAKLGNGNAEVWTLEKAQELFVKAKKLATEKTDYIVSSKKISGYSFHFVGEIAAELETYLDIFTYLKDKFNVLENDYKALKTRLESNCFSDSKKGIIKEATAIMNLKSNYGWTDRTENKNENNNKIKISFKD